MQSDKFDKKAREAAEHHHPAYDEQAWDRMEKLLDRHLPQKEEKKRRFIFIIFLFLFLGGSAWLLTARPWDKQDTPVAGTAASGNSNRETTNQTQVLPGSREPGQPVTGNHPDQNPKQQEPVPAHETITAGGINTRQPGSDDSQENKDQAHNQTRDNNRNMVVSNRNTVKQPGNNQVAVTGNQTPDAKTDDAQRLPQDNEITGGGNGKNKKATTGKETAVSEPAPKTGKDHDVSVANRTPIPGDQARSTVNDTTQTQPIAKKETTPTKTEPPVAQTTSKKKAKPGQSKKNSLSFTLSAGPDISFVGNNKLGHTKLLAGLGLEYTIKDRLSIRSGFYSARKIYTAKPSDYKAPPEFYQAYPYLEKVDANCRVYEIPLAVSWNFGNKSNQKWFVSAGVSSFLMNEETYNYFYKYTPTGNTFSNEWTIKNENYHMFSVGTLSAGYKRNVGKHVSLAAEPYVKIPFSGVGYGKVKLNSGGVLFTVGVKLF